MEAEEIQNRARYILMSVSEDNQKWLMELEKLARNVGCTPDELMNALHGARNFNMQPLRNFEALAYGYYSDEELEAMN